MISKNSLLKNFAQLTLRNVNQASFTRRQFGTTLAVQYAAKGKPKVVDRSKSASFKKKPKAYVPKDIEADEAPVNFKNPLYYKPAPEFSLEPLDFGYLSSDSKARLFSVNPTFIKALGPAGLPGQLSEVFDVLKNTGLVFRSSLKDILKKVLISSTLPSQKSLILDGNSGIGKSAILFQTVSCAVKSDWFVIYSAQTNGWVDSSKPYAPNTAKPSQFYQGTLVSSLLESIKSINNNDIMQTKISLKKDHTLGRQVFPAGTPLLSIVDFGIKTPSLSQSAFNIVLETVSAQTDVPVLIAIDQVNTFFSVSEYTDQSNQRMYSNRLLLIDSLTPYFGNLTTVPEFSNKYQKKSLSRGIVIGATSKLDPRFRDSGFYEYITSKEDEGKDAEVINIPKFTKDEVSYLLGHYNLSNLVNSEPSDQNILKLWSATSGNPKSIYKICTRFF